MKKTLVMGASLNPARISHKAVLRLQGQGIETLAFGLKEGMIGGTAIQKELHPHKNVDTVTLYLGPANQKEYYNYIISLKPRRVIFNPGTENPEFYKMLHSEGISFEVACTLVLLSTGQY